MATGTRSIVQSIMSLEFICHTGRPGMVASGVNRGRDPEQVETSVYTKCSRARILFWFVFWLLVVGTVIVTTIRVVY